MRLKRSTEGKVPAFTSAHLLPQKPIPNEAVSTQDVPILSETIIPDAYEALLEQERLGTLVIRRYHELPDRMLEWIRKVEADVICKHDLLNNPGPMADYYREHYPQSWQDVLESG